MEDSYNCIKTSKSASKLYRVLRTLIMWKLSSSADESRNVSIRNQLRVIPDNLLIKNWNNVNGTHIPEMKNQWQYKNFVAGLVFSLTPIYNKKSLNEKVFIEKKQWL